MEQFLFFPDFSTYSVRAYPVCWWEMIFRGWWQKTIIRTVIETRSLPYAGLYIAFWYSVLFATVLAAKLVAKLVVINSNLYQRLFPN